MITSAYKGLKMFPDTILTVGGLKSLIGENDSSSALG